MVAGVAQSTAATWSLDVALPADRKGTHMSRFVAWLDALDRPVDLATLRERHAVMLQMLDAVEGRIEGSKTSPTPGVKPDGSRVRAVLSPRTDSGAKK
jgi:GTP cyclohydrolase FolE2